MPKQLKFLWLALVLPLMAQAATVQDKYKEGQDYRVLSSQVQTAAKKDQIEVAEVFWYGCPHCYTLEPIVDRWKPSLEKDTRFVRVPGYFGPNIWKTHAQLYYTLVTMIPDEKKLHEIHDSIFSEVQNRNNRLGDVDAMGDFLKKRYGIDPKQFASFYNSFGVLNLMNQGGAKVRGYQLTGVPALVVDGRYVIEPKVGLDNMPAVADFLIKKVREERAAKAKPQVKEESKAKS
ncbi:thiol:disulfide interchange protein DsbA/DsbL [Endozoicomonas numazuensis]|uniref:thiol:disulfide interchange protein DsbA/DsbL n=1 Tax=Endozoicomonas numazuensis TaxID=1137799 RepID=UPI000690316F|nr:thiol:disulfide interchange protein DsbA/DsbL [Endozoicomonas numazuensis]